MADLDPSKNKKLSPDANKRRKVFKDAEAELVDALDDALQEEEVVTPGDAVNTLGRTNSGNIVDVLKSVPQRVSGKQFFENIFWKPKIVIRSIKGPELVLGEYYLRPNEWPSRYPYVLLDFWTECCRLAACAIGVSLHNVSTGFVFDYDPDEGVTLAQYFKNSNHGEALLINPTEVEPIRDKSGSIVYTKVGDVKGFKQMQRYKLASNEERERILASAIHEVTHLQGYFDHDWRFAAALTENMAAIMPKGLRILSDIYKRSAVKYRNIQEKQKEAEAGEKAIEPPLMQHRMRRGKKKKIKFRAFHRGTPRKEAQSWVAEVLLFEDLRDIVLRFERERQVEPGVVVEDDYPGSPFFIELRVPQDDPLEPRSYDVDARLFTKSGPKEFVKLDKSALGISSMYYLLEELNAYLAEASPADNPTDYWMFVPEADYSDLGEMVFSGWV